MRGEKGLVFRLFVPRSSFFFPLNEYNYIQYAVPYLVVALLANEAFPYNPSSSRPVLIRNSSSSITTIDRWI